MVVTKIPNTPLKINGWNIVLVEVWFRSFSFLFMGDGCRFQPLIFQGVHPDTLHVSCCFRVKISWPTPFPKYDKGYKVNIDPMSVLG